MKERYDYVLIDCMPSLGMITLNAFASADSVIVPVQAHYLPLKGMTQLMDVMTLYDKNAVKTTSVKAPKNYER